MKSTLGIAALFTLPLACATAFSQPPQGLGQRQGRGGFGGPGFPGMQEVKLVKKFDKDKNGWLSKEERAVAREAAKQQQPMRGGFGGPPPGGFGGPPQGGFGGPPPGGFGGPPPGGFNGPPGFGRRNSEPAKQGINLAPAQVKTYAGQGLYEPSTLRTLFFEFENKDWEQELQDFHGSDIDVPATLTVDGKSYKNVGVHFRGASSYMMVPATYKRSLNVSIDLADENQRLMGYKTLNLLNSNGDSTFMSTVLYSDMARKHLAAPKANLVRVVINGENWGIYTNVQQFDKVFLTENFKSDKGSRWKIKGSPMGDAGLNDVGDNIEEYKRRYDLKSAEDPKAWQSLIKLCKTLSNTPLDQLQAQLEPMLDIDSALWFLAFDNALSNSDGYWVRASDYSLYLDPNGKFHIVPHDMNEAFRGGGGPGGPGGPGGRRGPGGFGGPGGPGGFGGPSGIPGGPPPPGANSEALRFERSAPGQQEQFNRQFPPQGGPGGQGFPQGGPGGFPGGQGGRPMFMMIGGGGPTLDPLIGMDDTRKPLRSRLLAVPALRTKYLQYIKQIAAESLDWQVLGPQVARYRALIDADVKRDTKKLGTYEEFLSSTANAAPMQTGQGGHGAMNLRSFADQRREYLLKYKPTAGTVQPNSRNGQ